MVWPTYLDVIRQLIWCVFKSLGTDSVHDPLVEDSGLPGSAMASNLTEKRGYTGEWVRQACVDHGWITYRTVWHGVC